MMSGANFIPLGETNRLSRSEGRKTARTEEPTYNAEPALTSISGGGIVAEQKKIGKTKGLFAFAHDFVRE